jgi:hypothetical protein
MNQFAVHLLDIFYKYLKNRSLFDSPAYNPQKLKIIINTLGFNLVFLGILALVVFLIFRKKRLWFSKAALLLTILELMIFSRGNLITAPLAIADLSIPASDWLAQHLGYARYLSTSGVIPYTGLGVYWTHLRAREPFSPNELTTEELQSFNRFRLELKALPENQGMKKRLIDVAGYAAAIPKNYINFWGKSSPSTNSITIDDLADERLNLTGVRYLVTGYPQDYIVPLKKEKFKLVFEKDQIRIYKNNSSWPRAFLLSDDKIIPAKILSYEPNQVKIHTDYPQETQLVLTDTFYPGWEARLDGIKIPIKLHQGVFRSLVIPAGTHDIEFRFKPKSVRVGAIISLTTILALILILVWNRKRKSASFF